MDLEAAFDTIVPPEGEQGPPLYSVIPISGLRSYLVGKGQLPAERILVAAADTAPTPEKAQASRVEFTLR